jgi:hypothetical protein
VSTQRGTASEATGRGLAERDYVRDWHGRFAATGSSRAVKDIADEGESVLDIAANKARLATEPQARARADALAEQFGFPKDAYDHPRATGCSRWAHHGCY